MSESEELSADDLLDLTLKARRAMIVQMTENGPPDNNRDRRVLNEILNGAESTALGMKRIDNESDASKSNREVAEAALAMMAQWGNQSPFENSTGGMTIEAESVRQISDGDIADANIVEGELDIGVSDLTYDEFISQNQVDADEDDDT